MTHSPTSTRDHLALTAWRTTTPAQPITGTHEGLPGDPLIDRFTNLGRSTHPNTDHYRDGGMGGIGPDRSVVGFIDPHRLIPYREHDGTWNGTHSHSVRDTLARDLAAETGFTSPLMLLYDPREHWAFLGEGNHRLAAALDQHLPLVPVRVVRCSGVDTKRAAHIGAPARHLDLWGTQVDPGYCPSDLHPAHLLILR